MRIGVDVGGTKIEGILLDGSDERLRRRVATPQGDYDATVAVISQMVHALDPTGEATVGLGTPGSVSPRTGRMRNANSVVLNGRTFVSDVEASVGRPVRSANDADCLALSEAVDGAGAGVSSVFAVILGTGVGGGLVIDRRLITGRNGIAGEWGHNSLPWPTDDEAGARPCWCGLSGCIERWLSGDGLAATYREIGGIDVEGGMAVAARIDAAEPAALKALERYSDQLARGLASVVNIVDPDVIVLGGGVSNIGALYDLVGSRLGEYVFSDAVDTPVVAAAHGDSSGVRGAAWLWPEAGGGGDRPAISA